VKKHSSSLKSKEEKKTSAVGVSEDCRVAAEVFVLVVVVLDIVAFVQGFAEACSVVS
jgi:hypothetical protein